MEFDTIRNITECQEAAKYFKVENFQTIKNYGSPPGCIYHHTDNIGVYFNTHLSGNENTEQSSVCKKGSKCNFNNIFFNFGEF